MPVEAPMERRRRRRHVGGYPGTGGPRCYESTNRCSPGGLHRQPTCHTVRGWRAGVGSRAGRVTAARYPLGVSVRWWSCCGWHQKRPLALWPIEPTILRPGRMRGCWPGRIVASPRSLAAAPSARQKATASQQAVACMKHLVEAEKRIFRPKLQPKNFGRPGTLELCGRIARLGWLWTRIRCVSRLTELIKTSVWETELEHMHSHSLWRGAVTSSSDQSTGRKHVGFQRTPTKISLQIH